MSQPATTSPVGGRLVLVSTPIGNLSDISQRAIETLAAADALYCEDTRRTRQLLSHLKITHKKLISLHDHNEQSRIDEVVGSLAAGLQIAVVSDAGTPVVSDPGQKLVAAVAEAGFTVTAAPGPSAAVMALAISGLPAERFAFEGFLPVRGSARRERLAALRTEPRTVILYESPHRLARTVADLTTIGGMERRLVITRELTKLHEEVWRGTLEQSISYLEAATVRGEYTLVLEGARIETSPLADEEIAAALKELLADGRTRRAAVDAISAQFNLPRKRVYAVALALH